MGGGGEFLADRYAYKKKKTLVLKEKYFYKNIGKNVQVLTNTLAKMPTAQYREETIEKLVYNCLK